MSVLEQGFIVMILGMSIVFLLLLLLVLAVTLQAKAVAYANTFWPEPQAAGVQKALACKKEDTSSTLEEDEKIAIIIALAMHAKKQAMLKA